MKRGVAFFGPAGSGKTTMADNLAAFYGGVRLSFADALRKEYAQIHKIPLSTLTSIPSKYHYRSGLQELGDLRREQDPDYWVERLHNEILRQQRFGRRVFFVDDVRYENEYDMLRDLGFEMVLVEGKHDVYIGDTGNHSSEITYKQFEPDLVLPWHSPTLMDNWQSEARAVYERLAYLYYWLDGDTVEWNRRVREAKNQR